MITSSDKIHYTHLEWIPPWFNEFLILKIFLKLKNKLSGKAKFIISADYDEEESLSIICRFFHLILFITPVISSVSSSKLP